MFGGFGLPNWAHAGAKMHLKQTQPLGSTLDIAWLRTDLWSMRLDVSTQLEGPGSPTNQVLEPMVALGAVLGVT